MAYSQADIDTLKAAIASGVRRVQYATGSVEYHSLEEMRSILRDMEREVNPAKFTKRRVARTVSGF